MSKQRKAKAKQIKIENASKAKQSKASRAKQSKAKAKAKQSRPAARQVGVRLEAQAKEAQLRDIKNSSMFQHGVAHDWALRNNRAGHRFQA